jgi:hypothetical protein
MRRIAIAFAFIALAAAPSAAQTFQGNWSCRDATTNRVGILTIYGQVYGWAAIPRNDPSSGTGNITGYEDGVAFNDGNLRSSANIQAGRLIPDPNYGTAMQLETGDAIVMMCIPR